MAFQALLGRVSREVRNIQRLQGQSWLSKTRYVTRTMIAETFRRRILGALCLRLIEISLTNRCQCNCLHCYVATEDPYLESAELTTSEVEQVLADAAMMGVLEICFSGGEPLLREDLLHLISYARQKGLVTKLITNGILLNDALVTELKQAGLNWCAVSLDSADHRKHDKLRGYQGCFERAVAGLSSLVRARVPSSIITIAWKGSVYTGELEDIVDLGKKLGVTSVRINFPVPIGRFKSQDCQVLTLPERKQVRSLLRYGIVSMESPTENTRCTAGITKINVLPSGDVTPCPFVPLEYGNVRRQGLLEIWRALTDYSHKYGCRGQCPMCDPCLRQELRASPNYRGGKAKFVHRL